MRDALDQPRAAVGDPGLFGPGSVTWRVHAEPMLWLGGLRALLLQAVHPLAMAGVHQHSDFRSDPWGRLIRTASYVGEVTFGDTAAAERAGSLVRRVHRGLGGVEPETGQRYRVDDPALLEWVHCCEVDSFLAAYRAAGRALTPEEADQYVDEQRRALALVGGDPTTSPSTTAQLATYFQRLQPQLVLTEPASEVLRFVLWPPMPTWVSVATPARPAWVALSGLAVALLPDWARRLYGLPPAPGAGVVAGLSTRALRLGVSRLPRRLREGPHARAARERMGLAAIC